MKLRLQVIVESDDGVGEIVQEIAQLERGQPRPEVLGLTLMEAKGLLEGLQRTVVEQQITEYSKQQSSCPLCDNHRLHKGTHDIVYRTLFGKLGQSAPVSLSVSAATYPQLQPAGGATRRENGAGASLSRSKVCISRLLWIECEAL